MSFYRFSCFCEQCFRDSKNVIGFANKHNEFWSCGTKYESIFIVYTQTVELETKTLKHWQKQKIFAFPDKWEHIHKFWLNLTVIYDHTSILWALHRHCCVNHSKKFLRLDKLSFTIFWCYCRTILHRRAVTLAEVSSILFLKAKLCSLHLSKSITWKGKFGLPACWCVRPSIHVVTSVSGEALHIFCPGASDHSGHCLKAKQTECSSRLSLPVHRQGMAKWAHNLSATGPGKGLAAETNLGSGIKLDRRLTICPGNSWEGKKGIRDFAR